MFLQQVRQVRWKEWAAKDECDELKERVWLGLVQAMLRRKTSDMWTEKNRNVMRKLVVEGGWVQKRLFDIGWKDKKDCRGCGKEKGTEKHRLHFSPGIRNEMPEELRKCEQVARMSNEDWKWQRGITTHPPNESNHVAGPWCSKIAMVVVNHCVAGLARCWRTWRCKRPIRQRNSQFFGASSEE